MNEHMPIQGNSTWSALFDVTAFTTHLIQRNWFVTKEYKLYAEGTLKVFQSISLLKLT